MSSSLDPSLARPSCLPWPGAGDTGPWPQSSCRNPAALRPSSFRGRQSWICRVFPSPKQSREDASPPFYRVNRAWIGLRKGVHPATCCVSGEHPTGLAGRRSVQSHPVFWRSIIHLGLVGEVHMHNGKNNRHYWMEENGRRRLRRRSRFVPRGGLRGWRARSSGRERSPGSGGRRLAGQDSSDCSSGVVAGRS